MAKGQSRSSSSSRHDKGKDQSSSKTAKSGLFGSESSPELLHTIGRAVLAYSIKRLTGQGKSEPAKPKTEAKKEKPTNQSKDGDRDRSRDRDRDRDRNYRSRRSRSRSGSRSSYYRRRYYRDRDRDRDRYRSWHRDRSRSRDRPRSKSPQESQDRGPGDKASSKSDSNELHHLLGQVAVGLFGYGIRQYMHHRKLSKQRAAIARPPRRRPGDALTGPNPGGQGQRGQRSRGFGGWGFGGGGGSRKDAQRPSERGADPELAAALESITADLEGTSRAVRKLAGRSPGHKCEVHSRLRDEADGIQRGLERVQTSVNNVRNLHGGLRESKDMPAVAVPVPQTEGVVGAVAVGGGGGGAQSKRRMKKERGLQREGSSAGGRRRKRERSNDHGNSRCLDGERSRDTEGGYRHSSKMYSKRDREREERR